MNTNELIQAISDENFDVDYFVDLVCEDAQARDEVIKQLTTHPHIMVYYHCYYVADQASQVRPDLFLTYWPVIVPLLNHPNSYHRDIGMTLLANLTQVDAENRFGAIFQGYFEHLHDQKFMTGHCCVQNSLKIIKNKPELRDRIIALLLSMDNGSAYSEKQKALLKYDVLDILDQVYLDLPDRKDANEYMRACVNSASPKTRQKAKELVAKYGLVRI